MAYHVTFLPSGVRQAAAGDEDLFALAARSNVAIEGSCGGAGACGKCKVKIVSGKTDPLDAVEEAALTDAEIENGVRLACRVRVSDDLVVAVPQINPSAASRKTKLTFMPDDYIHGHSITKELIVVPPSSLENQQGDLERLLGALSGKGYWVKNCHVVQQLPHVLGRENGKITVVADGKQIIAVEPGDTLADNYGIAFDIGTTTVVGMLWKLADSQLVGVAAMTNPQNIHGADVISRINFSAESTANLTIMQHKVRDCFNQLLEKLRKEHGVDPRHIYSCTVVGNTTMSHLFLGVNPGQLAQSPFAPVFCQAIDTQAQELGLHISPLANVHLLANIAGHVGSDITAVILATRLEAEEGINLAIDVGTNGEIVLSKDGEMLVCSTAAGPAFEGAAIYQGMRAAAGAIESVKIVDGDVEIEVIDNREAKGICGSGLMDAVAELLRCGIIEASGRMADRETAAKKGVDPRLLTRLQAGKNGNEFVLAHRKKGEEVVLTQKDVREVQLAKGAIYAGILMMLREFSAGIEDLKQVIIAGAFGNYIKKESALRIGLFPYIDEAKIKSVGNAAGAGACLALLSEDERAKAAALARHARHIELAGRPEFQQEFVGAMAFPKLTDC